MIKSYENIWRINKRQLYSGTKPLVPVELTHFKKQRHINEFDYVNTI